MGAFYTEIIRMQNPVKILQSMFVEGGVEIVTPGVARTLIQPDADVIHYLDCSVLSDPDPVERLKPHYKKIKEFLDSLKGTKAVLDWFFLLAAAGIWIGAGVEWHQNGALQMETIIQFGLGFVPPFAKPGIIWGLKRIFKRRLAAWK